MTNQITCQQCGLDNSLECLDCNMQANVDCNCLHEDNADYVAYLCMACETVVEVDVEYFLDGTQDCFINYGSVALYIDNQIVEEDVEDSIDDDGLVLVDPSVDDQYNWSYYYDKEGQLCRERDTSYSKCRHRNHPVEFPDGVVVYPSSLTFRDEGDEHPDWGLYLDHSWEPIGLAGFIAWPDYSAPLHPTAAVTTIIDTYKKAKEGLWVEVGCIGGHGRTGTVLACMAILAGVPVNEAAQWVKSNYCDHAIEAEIQYWFIEFFGVFINGGSIVEPDTKSYHKGVSSVVPGRSYNFPDGKLDWENIDMLRANAKGNPPIAMLHPSVYLENKVFKSSVQQKIKMVESGQLATAGGKSNDSELPF